LDPYPPERLIDLLLALVPALTGAILAATSSLMGTLSAARRAALIERLTGGQRRALERYHEYQPRIELRWMVLRAGGVSLSALLLASSLPSELSPVVGGTVAIVLALLAFALPADVLRAVMAPRVDSLAPLLLRLLRPVEVLALPVSAPIELVGRMFGHFAPKEDAESDARVTEAEVEMLVTEGEQEGSLASDQSEMIRNVLDFGSVTAAEVMVPRIQVTAFDVETPMEEVLRKVAETEHSRYPIYQGSIDAVFGVLHAKDLLSRSVRDNLPDLRKLTLKELVRTPVLFVPEGQLASTVLRDMRARGQHLAIVIDEFGGTSGTVTLEDLLEQIVGEIRDEHDSEEPPVMDLGDGRLMVDAAISISELSRYLGVELPEDGDYNSLGGFLMARFGRVPSVGAQLSEGSLEFVVRTADERKISQVEILRPPAPPVTSMPPTSKPSRMSAA
jgi:putative hemolysin